MSVTDLQDFTAGGLILNTSGDIVVDNMSQPATLAGTTQLNATGAASTISFVNNGSSFNTLSLSASDGIDLPSQPKFLRSVALRLMQIRMRMTTSEHLVFRQAFPLPRPIKFLKSPQNDISLSGNLDSGTSEIIIQDSDGDGVGIGDTTISNGFNLSSAGMLNISAGDLTIRSTNLIVVDGVTQPGSITGATTLDSGDSISFLNSGSSFTTLDVQADDQITVSTNLTTSSGDLTLDGDANDSADTTDSIQFDAGVAISSAGRLTLRATTGGMTAAGALDVTAADGIQLDDSLNVLGTATINADSDAGDSDGTFQIALGAVLESNNQSFTVTANDVDLLGSIDAGTGTVTLSDSDSTGIGLGDATVSGGLNLTTSEAGNITSADLVLSTLGNVTVENFSQAGSVSGTINLSANGTSSSISFQNVASTFAQLTLNASDGIAINADLTVSANGLNGRRGQRRGR